MDTQLHAPREKAIRIYRAGSSDVQQAFNQLFDGKLFYENIREWEAYIIPLVDSFEAACKITGDDQGDKELNRGTDDEIALKQMKIFTKALNPPDWKADYGDDNQQKWGVYWKYIPGSGFRFYVSGYDFTSACTAGGSRLVFASEKLAVYAAKQPPFVEIYNRFLQ